MSARPGQVILGMNRSGFCIYINTVFEGPAPSVTESLPTDPAGAAERACAFATEREAEGGLSRT
jgi:hypothetical protein